MPVNPAVLVSEAAAAFTPMLLPVQAALLFSLMLAVSLWDIRCREIPDGLQAAIGALIFLRFSPANLLGILAEMPYLVVALFCRRGGIGGGDIKLAAATGMVLGLPASLMASLLGLAVFVVYGTVCSCIRRLCGQGERIPLPVGPFLAAGTLAAYCMKIGGFIL